MDVMGLRRGLLMGMANNDISVEFVKDYTVTESWENDSLGNPITIFQTLGLSTDDLSDLSQVFVMIFKNNHASNTLYKCDCIIRTKGDSTAALGSYVLRNNKSGVRGFSSSTSSWASIGTVIKIYKVVYAI